MPAEGGRGSRPACRNSKSFCLLMLSTRKPKQKFINAFVNSAYPYILILFNTPQYLILIIIINIIICIFIERNGILPSYDFRHIFYYFDLQMLKQKTQNHAAYKKTKQTSGLLRLSLYAFTFALYFASSTATTCLPS